MKKQHFSVLKGSGDRGYFVKSDSMNPLYIGPMSDMVPPEKLLTKEQAEAVALALNNCEKQYKSDFGDDKKCNCGHDYYRHFDSWDEMAPIGCKYCGCNEFDDAKSN